MRHGAAWGLLASALTAATASEAAKPARACIEAHAAGQVERSAGRLLRASEKFAACAIEECPALIRSECAELGATVRTELPSLVIRAEDPRGQPIASASAIIDAAPSPSKLDGAAISLDPGVHEVVVLLPDGRRQTLNLSLSFGEKARPAIARFAPAPPISQPHQEGPNVLAYVLGGAGLLGIGAWGAFAWDGRRRQGDLETCAPRCTSRSEVDAMRRSYLIADVLLGVSAAALGTSAYLLITNTGEADGVRERAVVLGARGRF